MATKNRRVLCAQQDSGSGCRGTVPGALNCTNRRIFGQNVPDRDTLTVMTLCFQPFARYPPWVGRGVGGVLRLLRLFAGVTPAREPVFVGMFRSHFPMAGRNFLQGSAFSLVTPCAAAARGCARLRVADQGSCCPGRQKRHPGHPSLGGEPAALPGTWATRLRCMMGTALRGSGDALGA